jgi:hypothetical protein
MKIKKCTPLFLVLLVLVSCKKDPESIPVEFPETTYQTLASYDTSGVPSNLLPKDNISSVMLNFIDETLGEKVDLRTTHPELLTSSAIADIAITQASDVMITFVKQITTSANTLGFYTYPTGNSPTSAKDIKQITHFFPNAGTGSKLKAGDKVKIGRFQAGTSIGFVLMRSAWDPATKTINNKVVHFCSNDALNPEVDPKLKKHAVLIDYPSEKKVLIGFENTDRTDEKCDHDFNDVVIYATVTP